MSQKNKKAAQHYSATVYGSIAGKNDGVVDYIRNAILYDVLYGGNCFIRHPSFRIPLLCGVDAKHLDEVRQNCADAKLSSCSFKMTGLAVLQNSVEGDILWLELEDSEVTEFQRSFYGSPVLCRTNPGRNAPLKGSHPTKVVTRIPICSGALRRVNVDAAWKRVRDRFKECFGNDIEEESFFLNKIEYEEHHGDNATVVNIPF